MAIKSLYFKNAAPAGATTSLSLQDGGTAPTGALTATGWTVAKLAANNMSAMLAGTKRASTAFATSDAIPTFAASASWRSEVTFNGTFANTNWTLAFRVRAQGAASAQTGSVKIRIWRSANADGSGATQLTAAVLTGTTTAALSTTVSGTSTVTWSAPGTQRLTSEYLWVQCEWNTVVASGSNSGDSVFYVESAGVITTPDFAPPPSDNLTSSNLVTAAAVPEVEVLTQNHVLTDIDLTTPAPTLATATITAQVHVLLDVDLVPTAPVLETPALTFTVAVTLKVGDRVLDNGLKTLDTEADKIFICNNYPATYLEASSTFALGNKNFGVGLVFGAPAAGAPRGRVVTSNAVSGGTVTVGGTPICWAVVDSVNSRLLAMGSASGFIPVTAGWSWTLGQIPIHMDG
jgi:hypothetical protein